MLIRLFLFLSFLSFPSFSFATQLDTPLVDYNSKPNEPLVVDGFEINPFSQAYWDDGTENFYFALYKQPHTQELIHKALQSNNFQDLSKTIIEPTYNKEISVVSFLARFHPTWLSYDMQILQIDNNTGLNIARILAIFKPYWFNYGLTNNLITDKQALDILKFANDRGYTVAHSLARHNALNLDKYSNNPDIINLTDNDGNTVYHILAKNEHWQTDDINILKLHNNNGYTVAHFLAKYNTSWNTHDINILKLHNNDGYTVAHFLAIHNPNWTTDDPNILFLNNLFVVLFQLDKLPSSSIAFSDPKFLNHTFYLSSAFGDPTPYPSTFKSYIKMYNDCLLDPITEEDGSDVIGCEWIKKGIGVVINP